MPLYNPISNSDLIAFSDTSGNINATNVGGALTESAVKIKEINEQVGDVPLETTSQSIIGAVNEIKNGALGTLAINDNLVSTSAAWSSDKINKFTSQFVYDNASRVGDWSPTYCTTGVSNGIRTIVGTGANSAMNIRKVTEIALSAGLKIYYRIKFTASNSDVQTVKARIMGSATAGTTAEVALKTLPSENIEYSISGIFTCTNQTGFAKLDIYINYIDAATANGKTISIAEDDIIAVDISSAEIANLAIADLDNMYASLIGKWSAGNIPVSNLQQIKNIFAVFADKYTVDFETVDIPATIQDLFTSRLCLVATKKDNYYNVDNPPIQDQQDVGFLYLDEATDKFYYSAGKYDNPIYLFDWNATLSGDVAKNWQPIIAKNGTIIFVRQGKIGRAYPIVYPAGDYANPVVVNTTDATLPAGMTTDTGACASCYGNFVIFGEYLSNGITANNGQPMRIWKISAPYTSPSDWDIVSTWYYSNTGEPWGENPTLEITHFHTIAYDPYTGYYYANTGDADAFCRVILSADNGDTWTEAISGNQKYRTLGYIFTQDACYWATDSSSPYHYLYKATRDVNGIIDWTTTSIVVKLNSVTAQSQRTYNTCLVREPYGLLMLDRTEPGTSGLIDFEFYSFEDSTLYTIGTFNSSESAEIQRYGFGNQACTYYQSVQENGIICGSSTYERYISVDVLNNSPTHRIGVLKIQVIRK